MTGSELLPPAFLARLERLQLATRRRLAGRYSGEHRSARYGTSLDFADYREYQPGDDFRRIDYHLYARLDVLALKLFEAEDDLEVRFLIDTSGSMATGGKLLAAKQVAAALGFVALMRRDRVSVHTFPARSGGAASPAPARFANRGARNDLFAHLAALEADGETRIADAASHLLGQATLPGLTVVISDLLTPDWSRTINRLPARGNDVLVVHVLAPEDLHPDLLGDLDLRDSETGARVTVSLSAETLREYEQIAARWTDNVAGACRHNGAAYVRYLAGESLEELLLTHWREEGVVR